jgi:hypothetical protein
MAAAVIALAVCHGGTAQAAGTSAVPVDREASEAAFLSAYGHFLKNRQWNCLDDLAESIAQNVYFVDAYYMRSLAFRRLGRYTDAIEAMSHYLEVRGEDNRARIILGVMNSEWDMIKNALSPTENFARIQLESLNTHSFLRVPPYDALSLRGMQGMGKISSYGGGIIACDTLGDKVWIFGEAGSNPAGSAALERPSAACPLSQSDFLMFQEGGGVWRMSLDASRQAMLSQMGELGFGASDAAIIDASFAAVADRRGGSVRFVELPSLRQTVAWTPPGGGEPGSLFEPVAVAAFGPLLAVADRGGGRVFVLDSYTLAPLDSFEVAKPRDLAWGGSGELYVLNEEGTLYARYPVGYESAETAICAEGMKDAWSLAWAGDGLVAASVSGRNWWAGGAKPGRQMAFGSATLRDPWIEINDGVETLMLKGDASSTFRGFIRGKIPETQVVWRGEARPSRVVSIGPGKPGGARFYSPSGGTMPNGDEAVAATSVTDVMSDIAALSRGGGEIPRVIVMDSRISGSAGQMELFLAFLLRQGARLDLWASVRPASIPMSRISRITLGRTYYSETPEVSPHEEGDEWTLSVPLPPDVTTFGYPSDTTLSLYAEIDVIRFSDWMPVWPSLMDKKENGEGVER